MYDLIPLFDDRTHVMVNEHLRKALCCPICSVPSDYLAAKTEALAQSPRYVITCSVCHHQGPFGRGLEDAVRQWNKSPSWFSALLKKWRKS